MKPELEHLWKRFFHRRTEARTNREIEKFVMKQEIDISNNETWRVTGIPEWLTYAIRLYDRKLTDGYRSYFLGISKAGIVGTYQFYVPFKKAEDGVTDTYFPDYSRAKLIGKQKLDGEDQKKLLFFLDVFCGWQFSSPGAISPEQRLELYKKENPGKKIPDVLRTDE